MQRIELRKEIAAPPEAVWAVLTDHVGWTRWAGIKEAVLRNEGFPPPNGVGAIRVFRQTGLAIEEEITVFEPPRRLEYRLTAGAPIREHRGEMLLSPSSTRPGGTTVDWTVTFRPLIPGTGFLVRLVLRRALGDILQRLESAPFPAGQAATGTPLRAR